MRKVSITDLRQRLPTYLKRVRAGEPIQITRHGEVIARIVAERGVSDAEARLDELRATARLGDLVRPLDEKWGAIHDSP